MQLLGCMSESTSKALMSCHSAQTDGFSACEWAGSPAPGHRQQLSSQRLLLVSSLSAGKASHARTDPSSPVRSPTWGWSGASYVAPVGRRDASEINRCHHAGGTLCRTVLSPRSRPAVLPCTCHVFQVQSRVSPGAGPGRLETQDGLEQPVSARLTWGWAEGSQRMGEKKGVCSHALPRASCHGCRKALDLSGGRMHKPPCISSYVAQPGSMP